MSTMGAYLGTIRNIEELRGRCFVDPCTDCWHYRWGKSKGMPSVNLLLADGSRKTFKGRRAALVVLNGFVNLPSKTVTYPGCDSVDCINPDHTRKGSRKAMLIATDKGRGRYDVRLRNLAKGAEKMRKLTEEQVIAIGNSNESLSKLCAEHGVSASRIKALRRRARMVPRSVFEWGAR